MWAVLAAFETRRKNKYLVIGQDKPDIYQLNVCRWPSLTKMQFYEAWVARFERFFVSMGVSLEVLRYKANIQGT